MNPLHPNLTIGTIGELLLQLRLLQYGVQASPPLKDSGNDLIAIRKNIFKTIQVKTTSIPNGKVQIPKNRSYHVLAIVKINGEGSKLNLDESNIYLIPREVIDKNLLNQTEMEQFRLSQDIVDQLFLI